MSTFFVSDLHLGHFGVAVGLRGFSSIEEHDEQIIKNWNKVVTKRDKVIIVGDVTMENHKYYPLLDRLRGIKTVVGGNHDLEKDMPYLLKYVDKIVGCIDYKDFCVTHIPIHPTELTGYYRGNIHGHLHKKRIMTDGEINHRYINVCLDLNDYTPVAFDKILEDINNFYGNEK
jgi:calcineurin-like phosphoesterase family protein